MSKGTRFEDVHSFEDLTAFLRGWGSFPDPAVYDFVGMAHLLGACLDNLRECANDADLDELEEVLDKPQRTFLKQLSDRANRTPPSDR